MAAKKVVSSKAGSVKKTVKSKAKSAPARTAPAARTVVSAKTAVSSAAKSSASAVKPTVKAKGSVAKVPAKPAAKAPVKGKTPAAKPSPKPQAAPSKPVSKSAAKTPSSRLAAPAKAPATVKSKAAAKGKMPAKATPVAVAKANKKKQSAPVAVVASSAAGVHETSSTISTGGQQATRSFSAIMQGHAAIAQGIEARKAAAKAKNLARFPRPVASKVKATRKLTPAQSKTYEQMLLRLRDELSRQIAFLRGASLTRSDEVNPEEDGSDAFERQLALKLASNEGDAIFEIDEALQRIKDGTYAICQDCGCIINSARLKALPFVRRCVECKRVAEKKRSADDRRYF